MPIALPEQQPMQTTGQVLRVDKTWPIATAQRVVAMAQQAVQADLRLLEKAREIVAGLLTTQQGQDKRPLAVRSQILAILHWVREHVDYIEDPKYLELVLGPSRLLDMIEKVGKGGEDCDGIAGLVMALLAALGIRTRARLVSLSLQTPNQYTHIFAEALIPKMGWVAVDPTLSDEDAVWMARNVQGSHIVEFAQ